MQKSLRHRQAPNNIITPIIATKQITIAAIMPAASPIEPVVVRDV